MPNELGGCYGHGHFGLGCFGLGHIGLGRFGQAFFQGWTFRTDFLIKSIFFMFWFLFSQKNEW